MDIIPQKMRFLVQECLTTTSLQGRRLSQSVSWKKSILIALNGSMSTGLAYAPSKALIQPAMPPLAPPMVILTL